MYRPDSRPSTAASSVDLAALASSFPLPPFTSPSSSKPAAVGEIRQTSPPWTAYRQSLPSSSPPLRAETPEEYLPHAEYFAATASTPQQVGRRGSDDLFDFDFDDYDTPALSSSSYSSSRSHASPFPSPTASSSSSIDSGLYNSPGRDKNDVGLGLWLEEQERKAAQMEQAMSEFSISAPSTSSTSYSSSWSRESDSSLPRFDPFGSASPVLVQRASFIKFEQPVAPPVQQRVHRPVPVRASHSPSGTTGSLLPAAVITGSAPPSQRLGGPSPFTSARPSYVAPGPDASCSSSSAPAVPLSPHDLAQVAALHNGRVPTIQQMAPSPQVASNGLPPPIVNTGNQGRMVPQMGDWRCGTCTFVVSVTLCPSAGERNRLTFSCRAELASTQDLHALLPLCEQRHWSVVRGSVAASCLPRLDPDDSLAFRTFVPARSDDSFLLRILVLFLSSSQALPASTGPRGTLPGAVLA